MGQTLNHGVYLPAEGERNCYAGLAANWNLLDTALGDIAGKASATHTHGNITNDGKLATADRVVITDSTKSFTTSNVTATELGYLSGVTSAIQTQLNGKAADSDVVHKSGNETIGGNKTFSGGLYSSNYYYGTTAWGLDKANTWTGNNTFNKGNLGVQTDYTLGVLPATETAALLLDGRTTDNNFITQLAVYQSPIRGTGLRVTIRNKWDNNGYSPTGTSFNSHFEFLARADKTAFLQWSGYMNNNAYPLADNTYNLGTTNNKWKTLNGINPGALSLPKNSYNSSYNIDTTNWATDGTIISYTPLLDGWLYINAKNDDTNGDSFIIFDDGVSSFGSGVFGNKGLANNNVGLLCLMMPVNANNGVNIRIKSPGIVSARLYPCNGNV